jgi:hypothetical protein
MSATETEINGRDVYQLIIAEVGTHGARRTQTYPFLGTCRIDAAEVEARFGAGAVAAALAYDETLRRKWLRDKTGRVSYDVELWLRYTATVTEDEARRNGWTPAVGNHWTGLRPGMRVMRLRACAPQPGDYVFVHYLTVA